MNVRPTRVPSPPVDDAQFVEVREREPAVVAERVGHPSPAVRRPAPEIPPADEVSERLSVDLPKTTFAKLAAAIANVMAEIKPVEKAGWNDFHKYKYAKMGDLSIELTPLMGRNGIVVLQNEVDRAMFDDGRVISVRYEFTIVHSSGEIWPERPLITGMSRCRDSKGGFDDKAFNKAHTAARKYFLLSLFQIPTDDEHPDADDDGGQQQGSGQPRQRPQGRRPVPSPNGKVPPHLIQIVDGEAPDAWTKRFGEAVSKATSTAEIDKWYDLNASVFDKLQRFEDVYAAAIDHMDACVAKLDSKPDPISTGKQEAASDFPGDQKAPVKRVAAQAAKEETDLTIPYMLDAKLTDMEKDWIKACDETFAGCADADAMAAEQENVMLPSKDTVSDRAWDHCVAVLKKHLKRLGGG